MDRCCSASGGNDTVVFRFRCLRVGGGGGGMGVIVVVSYPPSVVVVVVVAVVFPHEMGWVVSVTVSSTRFWDDDGDDGETDPLVFPGALT